jgi:cysteine desulfurase
VPPCYFDHNATTPLRPESAEAISHALGEWGNPSSVHSYGRTARRIVEDARRQAAGLAGVDPATIVFTGGGTEANNLALRGCGRERVLVSAIEHPSVLEAADSIETIPVDADGVVDLDALKAMLQDGEEAVVSVMLANNETGVIQPVTKAAALAHAAGALFHCDAVQGAGRLKLDFGALDADMMTLSAHKIGGPKGAGALIAADHVQPAPIIRGGGQERGRRSGTENVPGIAGFGAAAKLAAAEVALAGRIAALRDKLEERVLAEIPGARIVGAGVERLPNTSCIALPGISAETQIMALDLAGYAVSAGSACSSGKVKPSHVLAAMDLDNDIAACAIRASLGHGNSEADIEGFTAAYRDFAKRAGATAA